MTGVVSQEGKENGRPCVAHRTPMYSSQCCQRSAEWDRKWSKTQGLYGCQRPERGRASTERGKVYWLCKEHDVRNTPSVCESASQQVRAGREGCGGQNLYERVFVRNIGDLYPWHPRPQLYRPRATRFSATCSLGVGAAQRRRRTSTDPQIAQMKNASADLRTFSLYVTGSGARFPSLRSQMHFQRHPDCFLGRQIRCSLDFKLQKADFSWHVVKTNAARASVLKPKARTLYTSRTKTKGAAL